jgi:hypothetical protein
LRSLWPRIKTSAEKRVTRSDVTEIIATVTATAAKSARDTTTVPATTDDTHLDPATVNLDVKMMIATEASAHVTRLTMEILMIAIISVDTRTPAGMAKNLLRLPPPLRTSLTS